MKRAPFSLAPFLVICLLAVPSVRAQDGEQGTAEDTPTDEGVAHDAVAAEAAPEAPLGPPSGELTLEPTPAPPPERPSEPAPERASEPRPEAAPESASEPAPEPAAEWPTGFIFGSYGRVVAASNLDGGLGREADIVTWGPRLDEDTYAELELRRQDRFGDVRSTIVATVAVTGPLFHLDGDFVDRFAIRNLYLEVDDALTPGLALWAGSRMVRGDDIYLFNFWPLDNLNMVGGGIRYAWEDQVEAAVQVGLSRPNDPFQRQVVDVVSPAGFEPSELVVLDRPRIVASGKATWWPLGRFEKEGLKGLVYGESHHLSSGERERENGAIEQLPSDKGWVVGGQVGGWLGDSNAFANLFVRYARGLGAYDPLGVPFSDGSVIQTDRARELRLGLSANYEWEMLGVQAGAWYRQFRDADPSVFERSELAEGAFAVRPHVWFGEHAGLAIEAGWQGLETTALDERSGQGVRGAVTKIGVVPFYSPAGWGTYTRPHIRLIYALTLRDAGARALYPERDPRSREQVEHFLGVGAEWWFDSTSYQ